MAAAMPTSNLRAEAPGRQFSIRLSPDERAKLVKAAALHRVPVGEFVRDVAVSAAVEYLDETEPRGPARGSR
jgi:uncharacterized protein (DUF1778 family)